MQNLPLHFENIMTDDLTLATTVLDNHLLALCERLLVRENGEPWAGDAAKLRSTQLQKLRAYLETEELQPTYENVLCAASIQAYCDDAETAASDGSIASMADTAIRLLRFLDPEDEEMGRLEELKLHAEHRARERSAKRNAVQRVHRRENRARLDGGHGG